MDKKLFAIIAVFTVFVLGVGILIVSSGSTRADLQKTQGVRLKTFKTDFNFNTIQYSGGKVSHSYQVENIGDKNLQIANIATSCMCTTAYFKKASEESPNFGMKGMSAPSDWKGILKPGEKGEIVAIFDPSYHGPSGVGPVQRTVSFQTNDPDNPYVEFSFEGTVVK